MVAIHYFQQGTKPRQAFQVCCRIFLADRLAGKHLKCILFFR